MSKDGTTTVYVRSTDNAVNVELGESATFTIAHAAPASPTATAAAKSSGLCGAALLPLFVVGLVATGVALQRK